ncbi:MAG TPA: DMT family transporter [Nevskiaceae bacterium]|nr:DMT family transporter [Nevskiaceae bacterium]
MSIGIGEIYSLGCALAWAIAVILFKKSGESLPPLALNLFKNALSLVMIGATIVLLRGPQLPQIPPMALGLILLSGLLGIAAGDTYYFQALNAIGAGRIAVAQTLYSPFVITLSMTFLGEHLRPLQFGGVALVLGGIVLVTYVRERNHPDAHRLRRGVLTAVLAMFCTAVGIVMAKPMLAQHDFLWVVWLRIAGGFFGLCAVVLARGDAGEMRARCARVRHWPQVIGGTVMGNYVSMMLWLGGYKYTKASIAAVLNELAAVFIVLFAVLFLHERASARQVAGVLLAVAGVVMVVAL